LALCFVAVANLAEPGELSWFVKTLGSGQNWPQPSAVGCGCAGGSAAFDRVAPAWSARRGDQFLPAVFYFENWAI